MRHHTSPRRSASQAPPTQKMVNTRPGAALAPSSRGPKKASTRVMASSAVVTRRPSVVATDPNAPNRWGAAGGASSAVAGAVSSTPGAGACAGADSSEARATSTTIASTAATR